MVRQVDYAKISMINNGYLKRRWGEVKAADKTRGIYMCMVQDCNIRTLLWERYSAYETLVVWVILACVSQWSHDGKADHSSFTDFTTIIQHAPVYSPFLDRPSVHFFINTQCLKASFLFSCLEFSNLRFLTIFQIWVCA